MGAALRCPRASNRREKFAGRCRFPKTPFVASMIRPMRPAQTRRQTMRVMVFVKATEDSEKGVPARRPRRSRRWTGSTRNWSRPASCVAAAGLKPSSQAKRIVFDGPSRTVIDGPFAEARELVAGFSIWEVKDMDEAVAWVKRCPNPMPGPSEIEIRPFFEAADLAEVLTPEDSRIGAPWRGARQARRRLIRRLSRPQPACLPCGLGRKGGVTAGETHQAIEATFRIERARLIAGLARVVRNVDLAEELAQDALVIALVRMAEDRRSGQSRRLADGRRQTARHRRPPARQDARAQARGDRAGRWTRAVRRRGRGDRSGHGR